MKYHDVEILPKWRYHTRAGLENEKINIGLAESGMLAFPTIDARKGSDVKVSGSKRFRDLRGH